MGKLEFNEVRLPALLFQQHGRRTAESVTYLLVPGVPKTAKRSVDRVF
jgi:hypothetical protein